MKNTTLTLTVAPGVTYDQAVAALQAAGLSVEARHPVAEYVSEDIREPLYSVVDDFLGKGYEEPGVDLGILAELASTGYYTIVDEVHLKSLNDEAIRQELRVRLQAALEDNVSLAGFARGVASSPVLVVDGVTICCELSPITRGRRGYGEPAAEVQIGSAVDGARRVSLRVVLDIPSGRVLVQEQPLVL